MARTVAFLLSCLTAALVPLIPAPTATPAASGTFPGWPATFEGRALRAVELSPFEQEFVDRGDVSRIGKFTDGERTIGFRWIEGPTRHVHAVAYCYRAGGWKVTTRPIVIDHQGARWGAFEARRGGVVRTVQERIVDADGRSWTDVSSWYWPALLGQSRGPWWATTVTTERVERVDDHCPK